MTLRDQILRALYGGALLSTALSVSACGDEASGENENNSWVLNNETYDMGGDQSQGVDMVGMPDMTPPPRDQGPDRDQDPPRDQGFPRDQDYGDFPTPVDQGLPDVPPDMPPVDQGAPDLPPPVDMDTPDVPPDTSCYDPTMDHVRLPYDGWQADAFNLQGKRVLVCAQPGPTDACVNPDKLDELGQRDFLASALGVATGCSGEPEPNVVPGGRFCGPIPSMIRECCYVVDINFSFCAVGRPFTVDGVARLADVTRRDGWCEVMHLEGLEALPAALRQEIAAAWAESGTHEHASVASFGRFLMDLMSLGAPLELVRDTTRAIDDEIRHARDCFSVASAYAGMPLGPDVVDVAGSLDHAGDEAVILRDAILEGCIGETLAASVAEWMAPRVQDEQLRDVFTRIAAEESEHALLAWRFVSWMLETRPHLLPVAQRAFAFASPHQDRGWAEGASEVERLTLAHGVIRPATEEALRLRAYLQIVRPCAEALLAHAPAAHGDVLDA